MTATMGKPVYRDSEKVYAKYASFFRNGGSNESEFCRQEGIPRGTAPRLFAGFKERLLHESAAVLVKSVTPLQEQVQKIVEIRTSGPLAVAKRSLENSLPDAVELWSRAVSGKKVESNSRQAAEKLLKAFGLLAERPAEGIDTLYANMSDDQISARLQALACGVPKSEEPARAAPETPDFGQSALPNVEKGLSLDVGTTGPAPGATTLAE